MNLDLQLPGGGRISLDMVMPAPPAPPLSGAADVSLPSGVWRLPSGVVLVFPGAGCAVASGVYRVYGTVTQSSQPVVRTLHLHRRDTGCLAGVTTSDVDGHYSFPYLAAGCYYVVAIDDVGDYNAAILDDVTAVPM